MGESTSSSTSTEMASGLAELNDDTVSTSGSGPLINQPPTPVPDFPDDSGIGSTLLGIAAILISLAASITVVLYILPVDSWDRWMKYVAPAVGVMIAATVGILYAIRNPRSASPARLDPSSYGEIHNKISFLDARIAVLCNGIEPATCEPERMSSCRAACSVVQEQRRILVHDMNSVGTRWILGSGYVDLWTRLHVIEEALLTVEPREELIGAAIYDEMRLKGSRIDNSEDLTVKLRYAVGILGPSEYPYLSVGTPPSTVDPEMRTSAAQAQARIVLRDVRRAIDDFRDEARRGLVRAKVGLVLTGTLTALAAFALLAVSIISGATPDAIMAAIIFYLIGTVVGLLNQLRTDSQSIKAVEDFGLSRARVFHIPVISGLAAVGGVLVSAILFGSLHGGSLLAYDFPTATPTPTVTITSTPPVTPTVTATSTPPMTVTATLPAGAVSSPRLQAATPDAAPAETSTPASNAAAPPAEPTVAPTQSIPAGSDAVSARGTEPSEIPDLDVVFSLTSNRYGFLIAAIFGLTPGLLIDRLRSSAEEYKADMQSSTVS